MFGGVSDRNRGGKCGGSRTGWGPHMVPSSAAWAVIEPVLAPENNVFFMCRFSTAFLLVFTSFPYTGSISENCLLFHLALPLCLFQ